MRVLHLCSNFKWTGPAEPALNLCVALRDMGIDVDFACAPDSGASINKIVETARIRGIEPIQRFHLDKHRHPFKNHEDRKELKHLLKERHYDLIHCHLDNDHTIAAKPAWKACVPIVRSSYYGEGLPKTHRHQKLLNRTARLLVPSQMAHDHDAREFSFPDHCIHVIPGAIDTDRFNPARELPDGRARLGLPADAFVIGIVARMQTHRRYEDLFEAIRMLVTHRPDTHLIVVGRGTKQDRVGFAPVKKLGLQDHVHFTGFIDGDDYVGMLKAFDLGCLLVPGSDGTCRAVREMLAMAKPCVVADRGMLREIVPHQQCGLVTDGSAEGLFEAFSKLAEDKDTRRRFAQAARHKAVTDYAQKVQAQRVAAVYEAVLAG
ncbi:MAG: glycosyltransferase family 4 protein [Candidatus Hydrogenedentes bacterium]|nr:glycosyltransferase family 4 protein [Candidatus Hydrogenedentota bacterium]